MGRRTSASLGRGTTGQPGEESQRSEGKDRETMDGRFAGTWDDKASWGERTGGRWTTASLGRRTIGQGGVKGPRVRAFASAALWPGPPMFQNQFSKRFTELFQVGIFDETMPVHQKKSGRKHSRHSGTSLLNVSSPTPKAFLSSMFLPLRIGCV